MTKGPKDVVVAVRLDRATAVALKKLAREDDRTLSGHLRQTLTALVAAKAKEGADSRAATR